MIRPMHKLFATISFFIAGTGLIAQELSDPHLSVLPRTENEATRIRIVLDEIMQSDGVHRFETMQAGATTTRARKDNEAFSQPSANISFEDQLNFRLGDGLFKKLWVSSPSSTLASDGLGPLFNARSCQRCHIKDGRGHPPANAEDSAISMLMRISIPGGDDHDISGFTPTLPDPVYGVQLQDFGLAGHIAEYRLDLSYSEREILLSDGEAASLRVPTYQAKDLGYGPLHPDAMLSPRIAPPMIGLGLLEAIPASDILTLTDPDDANQDGISGRANIVMSQEFNRPMLGRFGLKAGMPTIREQSAAAFSNDIGISSPLFPAPQGDCTTTQETCMNAPHGAGDARMDEIDAIGLDLVTFYSRNLAVPQRRNASDPTVLRGKDIFYQTGCTSCHHPAFVTERLEDQPEQSFQLIWPYSDMLLHDMGEGLADHRPEGRATGREWRTPPLWGIGLTKQVSEQAGYLHDGRARNLIEAILWHGGEAERHKQSVIAMPKEDRDALVQFLESL